MIGGWKERNIFLDQLKIFFEMWLEDRKIRFAFCLHPGFKRSGGNNGLFSDKFSWNPFGFIVITCRYTDHISIIRVGAFKFLLQIVKQFTDLVGSEFLLRDLAQRSKLLTTPSRPTGRHVHLLVPA